jgi:hypothetical protein
MIRTLEPLCSPCLIGSTQDSVHAIFTVSGLTSIIDTLSCLVSTGSLGPIIKYYTVAMATWRRRIHFCQALRLVASGM